MSATVDALSVQYGGKHIVRHGVADERITDVPQQDKTYFAVFNFFVVAHQFQVAI